MKIYKYAVVLAGLFLLNPNVYAESKAVAAKTAPKETVAVKAEAVAAPAVVEMPENPILSILAADLNSDKRVDSAVLLKSGDQADLYIYLGNSAGEMELKLAKKAFVWSGALAGTLPKLKSAKGGGLLIYSENDAIGRNRWHQRLSVDFRDKDFVVTGFVYDEMDTLNPKANLTCDVNLLTGKGIKNKAPFKIDKKKIKLSDWGNDIALKPCRS